MKRILASALATVLTLSGCATLRDVTQSMGAAASGHPELAIGNQEAASRQAAAQEAVEEAAARQEAAQEAAAQQAQQVAVGPLPLRTLDDATGQWLDELWQGYQKAESHTDTSYDNQMSDLIADGYYRGFVMGAMDANLDKLKVPVGVSESQIMAIVGKYLDNHPEQWNQFAGLLVLYVLRTAAFPVTPSGKKYEFALSGDTLDQYWKANKRVATWAGNEPLPNQDFFYGAIWSGYVTGVQCSSVTIIQLNSPSDLSGRQVETLVGKYLDGHPEQWNQPAASLVVQAMVHAFPKSGG